MAFTIVTVAEMQFMAGLSPNAAGDVTANHQFLHDYAASYLSGLLKFEVIAGFSSITTNLQFLITEWAARFAGMQLMAYSLLGAADAITRIETEDRINIHILRMQQIEKVLQSDGVQDFMGVNT